MPLGSRLRSKQILAIDPGPERSAFVLYERMHIVQAAIVTNVELLMWLGSYTAPHPRLVIEMIASYGMPVGAEVFETCVWIGKFEHAWNIGGRPPSDRLFRRDVKMQLCGAARANDANVRQALIDLFGGPAALNGPLKGIVKDQWAALGVAVTYEETKCRG